MLIYESGREDVYMGRVNNKHENTYEKIKGYINK